MTRGKHRGLLQDAATARRFAAFACIDWSGAKGERLDGIAVARCARGDAAPELLRPPAHRRWSRADVLAWLIALADAHADILVGVDFSCSLPFVDQGAFFAHDPASPADARALWREIETICADDPHHAATSYVAHPDRAPCFRVGTITGARFAGADRNGRLRVVERRAGAGHPASCFNLVGAKQVGRSSLTGMRLLDRLDGRVAIWPFDPLPPVGPAIVEIYTSIAAVAAGRRVGATKMTDHAAMNAALARLASAPHAGDGAIDDHSSDAIVTAAWLRRAADDTALWLPERLTDTPALARTEGWTFGVR